MGLTNLRVAVLGCGPAGLAAALLLSRTGHSPVVFERFRAPAPVGSGLLLQPTGLAVLAKLGLASRLAALGAPIGRLFGRSVPSGRVVLDVPYSALGGGLRALGVHRSALFQALFDAAIAGGVIFETGFEGRGVDRVSGDRSRLVAADGRRSAAFDLVVDASGSGAALATGRVNAQLPYGALWVSLDWPQGPCMDGTPGPGTDWTSGPRQDRSPGSGLAPDRLEQRYQAARRMVGVMQSGRPADGRPIQAALFWSIKSCDLAAWRANGLDAWKEEVASMWPETLPLLGQISHPDQMVFACYGHRTMARPWRPGVAFVGDAAHSTSPQLGQGANMALLDAWALARAVSESETVGEALEAYAESRKRHVRLYQTMSLALTPMYQSDGALAPTFRDWVAAPVAGIRPFPRLLAALASGLWGRPLARLGLQAPALTALGTENIHCGSLFGGP